MNSQPIVPLVLKAVALAMGVVVVVLADGCNSLLTDKMRSHSPTDVKTVSLGIKEVIGLTQEEINSRFNLSGDEGAAYLFLGGMEGIEGGGFIYTNRNSLSVGIVCSVSSLKKGGRKASELIDGFKQTPVVHELVKGGITKEYSAALIPEGGFSEMPKLYGDGVLVSGSAAGLVVNNGVTLRGVDLAVGSGVAAAKTISLCIEKGDVSRAGLSKYTDFLREQRILQDLETFKGAARMIADPYLYDVVPKLACELGKRMWVVGDGPQEKILSAGMKVVKEHTSLWQLVKWVLRAGRSI